MSTIESITDIVQRELDGIATPSDIDALMKNKKLWRAELVKIQKRVEVDTMNRKAASMEKGFMNHGAMSEFHSWKARAAHFTRIVQEKLIYLKPLIKEENVVASEEGSGHWETQIRLLRDILYELESISDAIQERSTAPIIDAHPGAAP